MTIGIILIVAVLLLGGVLATLGDRIGTNVGKARLSVFNLRPRKTATLITIVTGVLISGTTLGILFASSQPLRRGIFEYDQTQRKLRRSRRELKETKEQKTLVEAELAQTRAERTTAEQKLNQINQSLQGAIERQSATEAQLRKTDRQLSLVESNFEQTQKQLQQVLAKFEEARSQLQAVSERTQTLRAEIEQLQSERQQLIEQQEEVKRQIAQRDLEIERRDRAIAERDRNIARLDERIAKRDAAIAKLDAEISGRDLQISQRDRAIAQREVRLKGLEDHQSYLERQVRLLEQYYQDYQELRQGNVALLRGQVLTSGVVRVLSPEGAGEAVDRLLYDANRKAIEQVTAPGNTEVADQQVIQITKAEVERLARQISDGRDYAIRILSAGNYVRGEMGVRVFADVAVNQIVFLAGEVVAAFSADLSGMSEEDILEQIDLLVESSKFRARRAGIVGSTIEIANGNPQSLLRFIEQLEEYGEPVEVRAVAAEVTYTAGPLKMKLVAIRDGAVIFQT